MKYTKYLLATVTMVFASYAFAGCPSGTFGIYFQNNTKDDVSVQVQDYATGVSLTGSPQQVNANNNGVTMCFSQNYDQYKLMQYTSTGNLEYDITNQTLVNNNYFMPVMATDTHFHK